MLSRAITPARPHGRLPSTIPDWSGSIVDQLIAERAPGMVSSEWGRTLLRRILMPMLGYDEAVLLAAEMAPLGGHEIFRRMAELLELRTLVSGIEHIPAKGPAILVANHPTGLADGVAVHAGLSRVRPDLWFLANADAVRIAPGLEDLIVPVEWVHAKRAHGKTRAMLLATGTVLRSDVLVVFPSGRLSYLGWRGLTERPWQATVVTLARRFRVPIVPMRLHGRNSALFYLFSRISDELRDITLFHELLDKRRRTFSLQIAPALDADELPDDPAEAVRLLQRYVEGGLVDRLRPRTEAGARVHGPRLPRPSPGGT